MKKNLFGFLAFVAILFVSCATAQKPQSFVATEAGRATITNVDADGNAISYGKTVDGFSGVTVVNCGKSQNRNLVSVNLSAFTDMELDFDFSCDIKVVDSTGAENDLSWIVDEFDAGFPEIAREKVASGEWTHFAGKRTVPLSGKRQFFLSAAGIQKQNVTIYIKNSYKQKISSYTHNIRWS